MKIRTRLLIFFSGIYISILILFGTFFYLRIIAVLQQNVYEKNNEMVQMIQKAIIFQDLKNTDAIKEFKDKIPKMPGEMATPLERVWATFYTDDFQYIFGTNLAKKYPLDTSRIDLTKKSSRYIFENIEDPNFQSDEKNRVISVVSSMKLENDYIKVYLVTAIPITNEVKNFQKVGTTTFNAVFFLVIITIIAGIVFIQYTLQPIRKITHTLHSISKDDLSQRLPLINEQDEIGELTSSINQLLGRLEKSFYHERQFISDISHELKTPLSVMRLSLEPALNNDKLTDEEIEKIGVILENLYSMDVLIRKLLYLSRLEQDVCPFHPESINILDLIKKVHSNLHSLADSKGLDFKYHVSDKELLISGDNDLLYMALFNIIENSIKYTDKGSVLLLVESLKNYVSISVEDTGIGIAHNELENIFEKFYRIDSSRSRKQGYGIGLSIVKRIILLHNGKIEVESIPDVKTVFTLKLPR
ncbi:MAG: HAMP domain-containing histidine kinase [Spirochaetes bacterium]|nr:HAMP domain-containing histidine kinase [Spirochaetota bacterium]